MVQEAKGDEWEPRRGRGAKAGERDVYNRDQGIRAKVKAKKNQGERLSTDLKR